MAEGLHPTEIAGPWRHRHVAANGARFHLVEATPPGDAPGEAPDPARPLVLLLHGFPEFWWTWRVQLPALAAAGRRVVAMDLRGYGGSDKTPRGYDPLTLARDVSGVIKALGERQAVLVGHGWGGYVGWAAAALEPRQVSGLCAVASPHPAVIRRSLRRALGPAGRTAAAHLLAMQLPMLPERRLADPRSGVLAGLLDSWSAPGSDFPDEQALATYQTAIGTWPASHCALEYDRWWFRSQLRADGRRFDRLMRPPLPQPVACLTGALDPLVSHGAARASARHVGGDFTHLTLPGVGHFPQEEDPTGFTEALLDWLAGPVSTSA